MTAINTQVLAEPTSCRDGADYLRRLAAANRSASAAMQKARSESEADWGGKAADAFRDEAIRASRDVDEAARISDKVARALDGFADYIGTCRSRMEQAREAAREGGLIVRGWWIEKPHGDPTQGAPGGVGDTSMPGLDPASERRKALEAKLEAWSEAESLVWWARRLENTAHEELSSALDDANNLVASLTKLSTWIGNSVAAVGALHGAAKKLEGMAAERLAFYQFFKEASANSSMSAAAREAHLTRLMSSIGITQEQAESNARALGNAGNTKYGNLIFNPLTKTFGGGGPGVGRTVGRMASVAGAIITGVESGRQIIFEGKPVGKTLASNFGSWGVGAGIGGGAGLFMAGAGAAAAPATIVGVGIGAAASWGYSYAQENTWEDFQHDSKEVAKETLNRYGESQEQMRKVEREHPGSVPLSKW